MRLHGLAVPSTAARRTIGAMIYLHGGPEGQARPGYSEFFPLLLDAGITVFPPNVRGSGGFGRSFMHADDREKRFAAIDDVADCVRHLVERGIADRTGSPARLVLRRISDAGGADVPSRPVRGGHQHLRDERPEHLLPQHRTVDRRGGLPEVRPPGERPGTARGSCRRCCASHALTAPLLLVHGANDTNVPASESQQMVEACGRCTGRCATCSSTTTATRSTSGRTARCWRARSRDWLRTAFRSDV